MPKKSRRRPRNEIGLGSEAIRQYDEEQERRALYDSMKGDFYNDENVPPSFENFMKHWRIPQEGPDEFGNHLQARDVADGRWRFVLTESTACPTLNGISQRLYKENPKLPYAEFKKYILQRYAISGKLVDLMVENAKQKQKELQNDPSASADSATKQE